MSVAEKLIRAWLQDPGVTRIAHDDDGMKPAARMRPTTALAIASAETLQGFGYVTPVGDGTYIVRWKNDGTY